MKNKSLTFAGEVINPGTKKTILISAPNINVQVKLKIPVHVFHGKSAGPKLFIVSALHGDELNSIEILRRIHDSIHVNKLSGTLIMVPVVNIYGVIIQSRYLPDGRDLNRAFPGKGTGTLASRLAYGITENLISQCDYGIDLHTGGLGRVNMPQLRVNLATRGTKELARAFDVPVIIDSKVRDGSLREAASELGVPLLVYEGGEALRLNEICIRAGVRGIKNVMHFIRMYPPYKTSAMNKSRSVITKTSRWVRSPVSGLVQPVKDAISRSVKKGDLLAYVHDPFLINPSKKVIAPFDGVVIGVALKAMASEGDPLFHIASFKKLSGIVNSINDFRDEMIDDDEEYLFIRPR